MSEYRWLKLDSTRMEFVQLPPLSTPKCTLKSAPFWFIEKDLKQLNIFSSYWQPHSGNLAFGGPCSWLSPMILSLYLPLFLNALLSYSHLYFSLERELWRNQNNWTPGRAELQSWGVNELTKYFFSVSCFYFKTLLKNWFIIEVFYFFIIIIAINNYLLST